jgi:hypothetical protein
MLAKGFFLRFSCKNAEQYETIGTFWDAMAACYPLESLCGIGYGWENDTLCYLIGRIDADFPNNPDLLLHTFPQAKYKELLLPDKGWNTYYGQTDLLDQIYDQIYQDGPLDYEIETFHEDGSCTIRIFRYHKH